MQKLLAVAATAAVVLVVLVLETRAGRSDQPTQLTQEELQEALVASGASFDPLRGLSGIAGAVAVFEATVVEHRGPTVTLHKSGFVDYDPSSGFPSIVVSDIEFVADLGSSRVEMADLVRRLPADSEVELWYSDGLYRPGGRYAFFLGAWSDGEYSALYGHDVETDRPATGFTQGSEPVLDRITDFGERVRVRGADASLLSELVQVASDLNKESLDGNLTERAAVALGVPFSDTTEVFVRSDADGTFPMTETDATTDELASLEYIEITVLMPKGFDAALGLEDPAGRYLGWFGVNDLGYAVISGYVPPATELKIVKLDNGTNNRSTLTGRDLAAETSNTSSIAILTDLDDETLRVVDLRAGGVVVEALDEKGYQRRIDELQPVLERTEQILPVPEG